MSGGISSAQASSACRLLLVNLLGPLAKGQAMTSGAKSSTGSISRRHVCLWTGSKTTKRGAEPRWQSTLRCGSGRTEEKRRAGKTGRLRERVIPHFFAGECKERG
jgi:hypothetical protein